MGVVRLEDNEDAASLDLKFLWTWLGEGFVARVLGLYARPVDPGFLGRVRFYGACTAVGEVAYGLTAGREANLRLGLAALCRAFSGVVSKANGPGSPATSSTVTRRNLDGPYYA